MGDVLKVDFGRKKRNRSTEILREGDCVCWHEFIGDVYIESKIVGIFKFGSAEALIDKERTEAGQARLGPQHYRVEEVSFSDIENYSFEIYDVVFGQQWIIGELIRHKKRPSSPSKSRGIF
jgi:hypothetical protein